MRYRPPWVALLILAVLSWGGLAQAQDKDKPKTPTASDYLKDMFKLLPPKERAQLLAEARKLLESVPPEHREEMIKQFIAFQKAMRGEAPRPEPKPDEDDKKAVPLAPKDGKKKGTQDLLEALDSGITKYGDDLDKGIKQLEETIKKIRESDPQQLEKLGLPKDLEKQLEDVEGYLGQARQFLGIYRTMPADQRKEMLKELQAGVKTYLEENVLPDLEKQLPMLKGLREQTTKYSGTIKEYLDAFKEMSKEERQQIIEDVVEAGKLFVEESIKPEIERRIKAFRAKVEAWRKLPRKERRKKLMEMFRGKRKGQKKDRPGDQRRDKK